MSKIELIYYISQSLVAIWTLIAMWLVIREYFSKRAKMFRILANNLKRKIAVITPDNSSDYNMENERRIIKSSWVFSEPEHFSCYQNFQWDNDFGIIIIWYKKELVDDEDLKTLLRKINWNTPIIFFTYSYLNKLDTGSLVDKITRNYLLNNFPLRLLWDVFSLMSIYKK